MSTAVKKFIRGQNLDFVMKIPLSVPVSQFVGTIDSPPATYTTTMTAQLRKVQNAGPSGLIAPLTLVWNDDEYSAIRITAANTENWALGPAEFDIVFTRQITDTGTGVVTEGTKFRSSPVRLDIVDGVTK